MLPSVQQAPQLSSLTLKMQFPKESQLVLPLTSWRCTKVSSTSWPLQSSIPEVMQAMILLNVMPKEYDGVAQTTLQTTEQSKLMFNYV